MKKIDLHVHSRYSSESQNIVIKTLKSRESYVEPQHIYDLAIERGMDFVTITDHDTIKGCLEIKEKYPEKVTLPSLQPEKETKAYGISTGSNEAENDTCLLCAGIVFRLPFLSGNAPCSSHHSGAIKRCHFPYNEFAHGLAGISILWIGYEVQGNAQPGRNTVCQQWPYRTDVADDGNAAGVPGKAGHFHAERHFEEFGFGKSFCNGTLHFAARFFGLAYLFQRRVEINAHQGFSF